MKLNRAMGLALAAAVLAFAVTGCSSTASSTASSAASSEAASSVAASEAASSEAAAASVVSTESLEVNGKTYDADCYGEFTLSNGDTMKLWKLNGAYDDLSALPMKGMVEEFPIEAEENTVYVADVPASICAPTRLAATAPPPSRPSSWSPLNNPLQHETRKKVPTGLVGTFFVTGSYFAELLEPNRASRTVDAA